MNVARNSASVAWTNWSPAKVRSSRGENWLLASCSVTTVRENVRAVTVIMDEAIASSRVRAASTSPPKSQTWTESGRSSSTLASSSGRPNPSSTASVTAIMGTGHSRVRTRSRPVAHHVVIPPPFQQPRAGVPTGRGVVQGSGAAYVVSVLPSRVG